jgi:putative membrane protein
MAQLVLVAIHVIFNLVWIGSITAVGWLVHRASKAKDAQAAEASGVLALDLYRNVAVWGFLGSFIAAVAVIGTNAQTYMHAHWLHGKITVALGVIALHHVIGARAKKVAGGSMQAGAAGGILVLVLLAFALLSVIFAVFKQALVP